MKTPIDLFNAYLDGDISADGLQRLEEWIAAAPANASDFLEWVSLQTSTYEALKGDLLEQVMHDGGAHKVHQRSTVGSHGRHWWLALAASLLIVAVAVWGPGERRRNHRALAVKKSTPPIETGVDINRLSTDSLVVATLTGLEDCTWRDSNAPLGYGQQLTEGAQVALKQGVVRVTFESGAVATLEGPCDFTVDNAMHGTIRSGRVSVTAPKRAYGFRIRSPNAEVIDLGTEFGVAVDDGGNSEVHVFSGEVLSRSLDAGGQSPGELFRLTANNGLKFPTPRQSPSKIASNTSMFARQAGIDVSPEDQALLPVDRKLALWLAADLSAKADEQGRVVAWSDILCGDNVSAEDALQPDQAAQPTLKPEGINGQPSIRFNGWSSYLVTTPLETTNSQTILMVCQYSKAALRPGRKRGGQLLNYNGPPHRLVSSTYEPGVLQIGEPIVEGFAPTRLGGKLFAGRLDGQDVSEAEMYTSALGAGVPVVLAYRYDLDRHLASLYINGELIEEKPALRPAGVISRKTIGRHGFMKFFFAGDIGELLIYNGALGDRRLERVTNYLGEKYRIELTPGAPAS